jgi:hypothetical protein
VAVFLIYAVGYSACLRYAVLSPLESRAVRAQAGEVGVHGMAIYFLIERPTITLRDRVLNRSKAAPSVPALKKLAAEA